MSLKNSNDTIGNRTRDLPVCSVVLVHFSKLVDILAIKCYRDLWLSSTRVEIILRRDSAEFMSLCNKSRGLG